MDWQHRGPNVLAHRDLRLPPRVEVDRPPQANVVGLAGAPDRARGGCRGRLSA